MHTKSKIGVAVHNENWFSCCFSSHTHFIITHPRGTLFLCATREDKPVVSGTISVVGGAAKDELDQEKEKGDPNVFFSITGITQGVHAWPEPGTGLLEPVWSAGTGVVPSCQFLVLSQLTKHERQLVLYDEEVSILYHERVLVLLTMIISWFSFYQ